MVKKRRRKVNHIIKKWMKEDGWTGQALAREVGVSEACVSHWRCGRNQPMQATADKLIALGCPLPGAVNHIIKKWMKKEGWTGQALAREVGVSGMQVSHWRTGRNHPRQGAVNKLRALGCPLPTTKGETPIHAWILAQGWTIAQAAQAFGVSRQTAYSWCYGFSTPQRNRHQERIRELTNIIWKRSCVVQKTPDKIATDTPPKGGVLSGGDSEPIIALKSTPRDKRKQSAVERPSSGLTLEQMVKSLKKQRRRR